MTELEKRFLTLLSREHQGRASYSLLDYQDVQDSIGGLIERGFVKHRRMGLREGVQITQAGRAWLGGEA